MQFRDDITSEKLLDNLKDQFEQIPIFLNGSTHESVNTARWAGLFIITLRARYPVAASVLDNLLAFEEATLIWRSLHPRMVERMMGARAGTGGSGGISYLDRTREVV